MESLFLDNISSLDKNIKINEVSHFHIFVSNTRPLEEAKSVKRFIK